MLTVVGTKGDDPTYPENAEEIDVVTVTDDTFIVLSSDSEDLLIYVGRYVFPWKVTGDV
jgi:hypothetical protein